MRDVKYIIVSVYSGLADFKMNTQPNKYRPSMHACPTLTNLTINDSEIKGWCGNLQRLWNMCKYIIICF